MQEWRHLQASERERALFPDLASALARAGGRAGPLNRFREVRRVETGEGTYFLKIFTKTQHKNRLRNALTAPRCRLDGEREALVAEALATRGVAVARPVAVGVHDGASYYLCAELPGSSLHDLLAAGRLTRVVALAAARFAGDIARRGVVLTDVSTDHVFVAPDGGFAVIDLHNGRVAPRPGRRDVRRMLRRFARSVRGLAVPRRAAMAFAVRFLDALGCRHRARALLAGLPPIDTHARYDAPGKSAAYRDRNPGRHAREVARLQTVWPGRPGDRVLDLPCGAGRLSRLLTDQGAHVVGADRSWAMLREHADARPDATLVCTDATAMPFADRSFDGVVVFRFLHHLPPDLARRVVHEAARVAGRYVVVSFFHPVSAHGVRRRLGERLTGRARTRHAHWPGTLRGWLAEAGFDPVNAAAEAAYRREFWVAAFSRRADDRRY